MIVFLVINHYAQGRTENFCQGRPVEKGVLCIKSKIHDYISFVHGGRVLPLRSELRGR